MRQVWLYFSLLSALVAPASARGPDFGGELLKLVPPDAGATLVVEDLRGHARSFLESPLSGGIGNIPVIRDWRESDGGRRLDVARKDIERALGTDLKAIRDDIFGDAFVLSIHAEPAADPGGPKGLLLVRARDRRLLDRLIAVLNAAERASGELVEVAPREERGAGTYFHRRFRPGTKADNWYAIVGDATFAWSNSEALIRGVLGRRAGALPGLESRPEARQVRSALPGGAVASLLADPAYVARLLDADAPSGKSPRRIRAYLDAVRYLGAAVEWRDGLITGHIHAAYDPPKVPAPHRRWADRATGGPESSMPADALGMASIPVDFSAIGDLIFDTVDGDDLDRASNIRTAVDGLFGRDLRREVLPKIRPEFRLLIRDPGKLDGRLPIALTAPIEGGADSAGVAASIENGLRTALAFTALEADRAGRGGRVEPVNLRGFRLTTLSGPPPNYSFSADRGRITLGNSPEAVAWSLSNPPGGSPRHLEFERVRAAYFPDAGGFAFFDLDAFDAWATARRPEMVDRLSGDRGGSKGSAGRDLDTLLALGRLFRSAFATGSVGPGFREAHLRLGLVVRGAKPSK